MQGTLTPLQYWALMPPSSGETLPAPCVEALELFPSLVGPGVGGGAGASTGAGAGTCTGACGENSAGAGTAIGIGFGVGTTAVICAAVGATEGWAGAPLTGSHLKLSPHLASQQSLSTAHGKFGSVHG